MMLLRYTGMVPAAKRRRHRRLIGLGWFTLATFLIFVAFFDMVTR
jgi:hypothetical protein